MLLVRKMIPSRRVNARHVLTRIQVIDASMTSLNQLRSTIRAVVPATSKTYGSSLRFSRTFVSYFYTSPPDLDLGSPSQMSGCGSGTPWSHTCRLLPPESLAVSLRGSVQYWYYYYYYSDAPAQFFPRNSTVHLVGHGVSIPRQLRLELRTDRGSGAAVAEALGSAGVVAFGAGGTCLCSAMDTSIACCNRRSSCSR